MPRRWLHLEPLLAVILWGGVYPGAKLGLREIPTLSFTYLRILVAMVVLFLVAGRTLSVPRVLRSPLLYAGLAQTAFQLLLIAGIRWTTAGNSAILLATAPLLTAVWLAITGQARLQNRQWSGLLLGLVGVSLVVQHGSLTWAHLGGDLLALGAAAAWAWYGIVIAPLVGALGSIRATGWSMFIAAACFTPLAWHEVWSYPWQHVSWPGWLGLLYGATIGMVVAMTLWGKALYRFGTQHTMLYVYLEPLSAVAIAAVLLGEALWPWQAVGALLTLLGVALASSGDSEKGDV